MSGVAVGRPDDPFEREADRVAYRIMRMPAAGHAGAASAGQIGGAAVQRRCPACGRGDNVQRQYSTAAPGVTTPASGAADANAAVRLPQSGGRTLPDSARRFFEPRFGYDFGPVRIHTDAPAARMNQALNARAFTYGRDIYFDRGEFNPGTAAGRHLLAHELTHVVQQRSGRAAKRLSLKKRVFTPGRPAHNHKPGHWAAVQADADSKCNPITEEGRIHCVCANFDPENVMKLAMFARFRGKPIATKHLEHYLTGGGKEFDENSNLTKLINDDAGVRKTLAAEIAKSPKGHVFIQQGDYTNQDFRFAFGGIDRVEWEVDKAAGTVDIWFIDRYDFHPVGFGYKKHSGPGDIKRITNCVHAAAVEMKAVGSAADYWMKGEATFPLSKFPAPGSSSKGGGDDL